MLVRREERARERLPVGRGLGELKAETRVEAGLYRIATPEEIAVIKAMESVVEFLKREDGSTAVEYAVMLALIVVACIAAIGSASNQTFSAVGSSLKPS